MSAQVKDALHRLRPGAQWTVYGDDYSTAIWHDDTDPPSQDEVEREIASINIEREALAYRALRAEAYPSIGDQLDALYHAGVFPAEMAAQIAAVKKKFPKSAPVK